MSVGRAAVQVALVPFALFGWSCVDVREIRPPEGDGAKSMFLAFEGPSRVELFAMDLVRGESRFAFSAGEQPVFALLFDRSLAEMEIEPGSLSVPGDTDPWRPIPDDARILRSEPFLEPMSWLPVEREQLPAAINDRRFIGTRLKECDAAPRCVRMFQGEEYCQIPCVEPIQPERPRMSPALPELPSFLPCPTGWQAKAVTSQGDVTVCEPRTSELCDPGAARYPGRESCQPPMADCPLGDWPVDLPSTGPAVYVRSGSVGGNGTQNAPFGRISDAQAAGPTAVIALGPGELVEEATLTGSQALIGVCADRVVLRSNGEAVVVANGNNEIRGVTMVGSPSVDGVRLDGAGSVHLSQVNVDNARFGCSVHGVGEIVATELQVRGCRTGLVIDGGGSGVIDRSIFENNEAGITVGGAGSSGALDQVLVAATSAGRALRVIDGAHGDIRRSHFRDNRIGAIVVHNAATASISDTWITGTGHEHDVSNERPLLVIDARLEASRVVLEANSTGIHVSEADAKLSDLLVTDSGTDHGLRGTSVRSLVVQRAVFERNADTQVISSGRRIELDDIIVREGTRGRGEGIVLVGAVARLGQILIEDATNYGLVFRGGTVAEVSDLTVSRTSSRAGVATTGDPINPVGVGLTIRGSDAEIERAFVEESTAEAVRIDCSNSQDPHGPDVSITDLVALDSKKCGLLVKSCELGNDAHVDISRAIFERNGGGGIGAKTGVATFRDLSVVDATPIPSGQWCGALTTEAVNASVPYGVFVRGLAERIGALSMQRVALLGSAGTGIVVDRSGVLESLEEARIENHRVGIDVLHAGAIGAIESTVIYRSNETNFVRR